MSRPTTPRSYAYAARQPGALLVLLALVVAVAAAVAWGSATEAKGPALQVSIPAQVVVGEPIPIGLTIRNANGVAGYEARLLFDTAVAHLQGLEHRNNDLKKLGRDVQTLGPIEVPGGVSVGAYSCPFQDCADTVGKPKKSQGGRGTVKLATVSVVADKAGPLTVQLADVTFVDASGTPVVVDLGTLTFNVQVVEGQGQ